MCASRPNEGLLQLNIQPKYQRSEFAETKTDVLIVRAITSLQAHPKGIDHIYYPLPPPGAPRIRAVPGGFCRMGIVQPNPHNRHRHGNLGLWGHVLCDHKV